MGGNNMENVINEEQLYKEAFDKYIPRSKIDKSGYHWVEREINKLDPHTHY